MLGENTIINTHYSKQIIVHLGVGSSLCNVEVVIKKGSNIAAVVLRVILDPGVHIEHYYSH